MRVQIGGRGFAVGLVLGVVLGVGAAWMLGRRSSTDLLSSRGIELKTPVGEGGDAETPPSEEVHEGS